MDAKETVMRNPELEAIVKKTHDGSNELLYAHDLFIAQAQAEISFKAGQEGRHSISTIVDVGNDAFKDGRKVGIKDVVDWIETYPHETHLARTGRVIYRVIRIPIREWQAQLKKWGL